MTEAEAIAEAAKREKNKSKFLTSKIWKAVHDSVKGWHVALVDNHIDLIYQNKQKAARAIVHGDTDGLVEAAGKILMSRVALTIDAYEAKHGKQP